MRLLAPLLIALAVVGCASQPTPKSSVPAKQISSRQLDDFLSGYVRVVSKSNGQELFCSRVHFRLGTCYTRAQMQERLLASLRPGPLMTLPAWSDVTTSDSSFSSGR